MLLTYSSRTVPISFHLFRMAIGKWFIRKKKPFVSQEVQRQLRIESENSRVKERQWTQDNEVVAEQARARRLEEKQARDKAKEDRRQRILRNKEHRLNNPPKIAGYGHSCVRGRIVDLD